MSDKKYCISLYKECIQSLNNGFNPSFLSTFDKTIKCDILFDFSQHRKDAKNNYNYLKFNSKNAWPPISFEERSGITNCVYENAYNDSIQYYKSIFNDTINKLNFTKSKI